MSTFTTNETTVLQLDDARRGCLTAAAALRCVAGDAVDPLLLSEAQRLHSGLCNAADELAGLRDRARVTER